jgi:CRP-like cAMP-binding protein
MTMIATSTARAGPTPPLERLLSSFSPLSEREIATLREKAGRPEHHRAGAEISSAASEDGSRVVVNGWAGWAHTLPDGRRQIVALFLPGDLVRPAKAGVISMTNVALTPVQTASIEGVRTAMREDPANNRRLLYAWRLAAEAADAQLVRHAIRLGRYSAFERTADLVVELLDRQRRAGLLYSRGMAWPLTQEILADILGLSIVHVNRTLQQMRRERLLEYRSGHAVADEERLAKIAAMADG